MGQNIDGKKENGKRVSHPLFQLPHLLGSPNGEVLEIFCLLHLEEIEIKSIVPVPDGALRRAIDEALEEDGGTEVESELYMRNP